jgi:hypothetical protein
VKIVVDPSGAAAGSGYLQIRLLNSSEDAFVIFQLPPQTAVDPQSKLVAWVRRADAGKPIQMHWFALDGDNWVIFQRRFEFDQGQEWVKLEWPLSQWRWGNERTGEWADVRSIALRVESETAGIDLDDVILTGDPTSDPFREDFLRKMAFPDRKSRVAVEDGFLAGTDAMEEVSLADLKAVMTQMRLIREWTRRTFGEALRPTGESPPMALLLFRGREDYQAFYKRLGEWWNVDIVPPRGGGYTVQDISACVYEANGVRGPAVAFHESVHTVIGRQLRLLPGSPAHAWLQEGLANYLQLCLYPESLRPGEYAENFSHPIGPKTFFRPLGEIIGKPVQSRHYAQLASLTAYLVEERPDWLRQIAQGLAGGKELDEILKGLDTDLPQLERLWFEWGMKKYPLPTSPAVPASPAAPASPSPKPQRHFRLPEEWAARTLANATTG